MARRSPRLRILVAAAALAALLAAPASGQRTLEYEERSEPGLWNKVVDATIVRPLGLLPIAFASASCAAWVVFSWPVVWLRGEETNNEEICFTDPIGYTFERPLGEY